MSLQKMIAGGRGWKLFALVGAALLLLYFLPAPVDLQSWLIVIVGALTTVALVFGYRVFHPQPRIAWILFLLSQVANTSGDLANRLSNDFTSGTLLVSIGSDLYLVGDLSLLIGAPILFWHYRRLLRRDSIPQGLIIGIGFALLAWDVVIYPNLTLASVPGDWFSSLADPAGIVIVAFLASLFLLSPLGNAWCFRFLFGVLLFQELASYAFAIFSQPLVSSVAQPFWSTHFSDVSSCCALILLGLAYLHPSLGTLNKLSANKSGVLSLLDMLSLALAFSVAPVALILQAEFQLPINVIVVIMGMLVVFALIEWRLAILLGVLASQNQQLRSLDKLKTQFLANMSHELRTPLNSIINFSQFTESGMYGPVNDGQREAMVRVTTSGEHLLSMINDVLDITKIQADMINLFVERDISLHDELETAAAMAQGILANKPVELVREIPPDLPLMVGDRRRIRQIFINLLSNACKFTEQGQVVLRAERQDGHILVTVHDTGPGIPAEDQTQIFEPFQQAHAGLRDGSGSGLGFAIARSFVNAHCGQLWLESQLNVGTTFFVSLPLDAPELDKIAHV